MINLKYTGNKPLISQKGISFESKEDKYEYIEPSAHLLKLISQMKNSEEMETLSPKKLLNQNEILEIIYKEISNIEQIYENKISSYKKSLDLEKSKIDEIPNLNENEKEVFKRNFDFMLPYRIQRETNKIVYEEIMEKIANLTLKKEIKEIKTPLSKTFLHVLQSLKNRLFNKYPSLKINILAKLDRENPYITLEIK